MEATSPGHRITNAGATWSIFDYSILAGGAYTDIGSGSTNNISPAMDLDSMDIIGNSAEDLTPRSMDADLELYWQLAYPNESSSGLDTSPIASFYSADFNLSNGGINFGSSSHGADGNARIQGTDTGFINALEKLGINLETAAGAVFSLHPNGNIYTNFTGGAEGGTDGDLELGEGHGWDNLWRVIPLGIVLAFLCLLTTAGNIMVLHAVRTEKRLQTVSNVMPSGNFLLLWKCHLCKCSFEMAFDDSNILSSRSRHPNSFFAV